MKRSLLRVLLFSCVLSCVTFFNVNTVSVRADDLDEIDKQIEELESQLSELKKKRREIAKENAGEGGEAYEIVRMDFNPRESFGEYYADPIIEVVNTGAMPIYLAHATLDVEDGEGHILGKEDLSEIPNVISPGETGYLYLNFGMSLKEGVDPNSCVMVPHFDVIEIEEESHRYPIEDDSLQAGSYGSESVVGRLTNDTDEEDGLLYIGVLWLNSEGKCIGISGTNDLMGIKPGETRSFEVSDSMASIPEGESISDYKLIAEKTDTSLWFK